MASDGWSSIVEFCFPRFLFCTFFVALVVSGCEVQGVDINEESGATGEQDSEGPPLSKEKVRRQLVLSVLDRMFKEGNSEDVLSSAGGEMEGALLEAGAVVNDEGRIRVEYDITTWDVHAGPGQGSISEVDSALWRIMRANSVTWCAKEESGVSFIVDYSALDLDSYNSYEEYNESISDYVDCGPG